MLLASGNERTTEYVVKVQGYILTCYIWNNGIYIYHNFYFKNDWKVRDKRFINYYTQGSKLSQCLLSDALKIDYPYYV